MRYQNKVTIITGAAQGIGAGCARVFASAGASIIIADRKEAAGRAVTEASGGVTLDTVRLIAETGVDWISIGAITHSSPALNIGFERFDFMRAGRADKQSFRVGFLPVT